MKYWRMYFFFYFFFCTIIMYRKILLLILDTQVKLKEKKDSKWLVVIFMFESTTIASFALETLVFRIALVKGIVSRI